MTSRRHLYRYLGCLFDMYVNLNRYVIYIQKDRVQSPLIIPKIQHLPYYSFFCWISIKTKLIASTIFNNRNPFFIKKRIRTQSNLPIHTCTMNSVQYKKIRRFKHGSSLSFYSSIILYYELAFYYKYRSHRSGYDSFHLL